CVMRRVCEDVKLVQVGIRAISSEEVTLMRKRKGQITTIFAEELEQTDDWQDRAIDALGEDVYITIDVDYFDPSLVPSTGTPESGSGQRYAALKRPRRA